MFEDIKIGNGGYDMVGPTQGTPSKSLNKIPNKDITASSMYMNGDYHQQLNNMAMNMGMSNLALQGAGIIHGKGPN